MGGGDQNLFRNLEVAIRSSTFDAGHLLLLRYLSSQRIKKIRGDIRSDGYRIADLANMVQKLPSLVFLAAKSKKEWLHPTNKYARLLFLHLIADFFNHRS